MSEENILEKLELALTSYSPEETEKVAQETIEKGIDPLKSINVLGRWGVWSYIAYITENLRGPK